jgi:hypothetical protein
MDMMSMRNEARDESAPPGQTPTRRGWPAEVRRLCAMLSRAPEGAMSAASLVIRLDDRERREEHLLGLCRRLAEEYGLVSSVGRDGDTFTVRFGRREQAADELGLLRRRLERELRPLCRGLARCTWSDTLEAVSTAVSLPDDAAHEHLLRAVCRQLGDEFGLGHTVGREGDTWAVRFTRPVAADKALGVSEPYAGSAAGRALRGALARLSQAARRFNVVTRDAW